MLLVVEDHEDTRHALVRLLTNEGYMTYGVKSGEEALEFLKTFKPLLVILDHNMAGMDGLAVLRQMKSTAVWRDIPVMIYSASDGDLKQAALGAGADAYVVKKSLDWRALHGEVIRFVGPGSPKAPTPTLPKPKEKEAG